MKAAEELALTMELMLNNARELQRTTRQFERKKLSRVRYSAAVGEIALKIEQWVIDSGVVEQKRTERCQVCDQTYPASEIVRRGNEQLCVFCDWDKYPIRDEDIPF